MPINKFGQYLNETRNIISPFEDKATVDAINCGGKRLEHVQKSLRKGDAVNKFQLDRVEIALLAKFKILRKDIDDLRNKLEKLTLRITTPSTLVAAAGAAAAAAAKPSLVPASHLPPKKGE